MQLPRVIPALLLRGEEFVKTTRFSSPRYVGDPINTIDLFNQFEVDEIALLDIAATVDGLEPAYDLIETLAGQCWVPLTYGGGIRTLRQAQRVFSIGVEKVVLGTALVDEPQLAGSIAEIFGRQAVVAAVDVAAEGDGYSVRVRSGTTVVGRDPEEYARRAQDAGAGEILLQAIHRDGTRDGYDINLIERVSHAVDVPVVALGGARRRHELSGPIDAGAAAVAAGSLFVFQGVGSGVLVNFPSRGELESLFGGRPGQTTTDVGPA